LRERKKEREVGNPLMQHPLLVAELVREECDSRTKLRMCCLCKGSSSSFSSSSLCWRNVLLCHKAFRAWRRSRKVARPLVVSWERRRRRTGDDTPILVG
jgi:hypothetical protein